MGSYVGRHPMIAIRLTLPTGQRHFFLWVGPKSVCATSANLASALSENRPTRNPNAVVRPLVETRLGSNTPNDSITKIMANARPPDMIGMKYLHHLRSMFQS